MTEGCGRRGHPRPLPSGLSLPTSVQERLRNQHHQARKGRDSFKYHETRYRMSWEKIKILGKTSDDLHHGTGIHNIPFQQNLLCSGHCPLFS